jgi:hypothetical protein
VDPQRDVLLGVLAGERQHLRREDRPVVVVEHAVEHQHALAQEPLPQPVVEQRRPVVVRHASTMPPPGDVPPPVLL